MKYYSVSEAAELAGVPANTLRVHITRRKLATVKRDGHTVIEETALHAYMTAEGLAAATEQMKGKPIVEQADAAEPSISELFARLPPGGQEALIEGIRTQSPEPWRKWKAQHDREMAGRETVPLGEAAARRATSRPVPKSGKKPAPADEPF